MFRGEDDPTTTTEPKTNSNRDSQEVQAAGARGEVDGGSQLNLALEKSISGC